MTHPCLCLWLVVPLRICANLRNLRLTRLGLRPQAALGHYVAFTSPGSFKKKNESWFSPGWGHSRTSESQNSVPGLLSFCRAAHRAITGPFIFHANCDRPMPKLRAINRLLNHSSSRQLVISSATRKLAHALMRTSATPTPPHPSRGNRAERRLGPEPP